MRLGIHCSIKYGFEGAIKQAVETGCDCMQMFVHSPRVWNFSLPKLKEAEIFNSLRQRYNIAPLIIHTAYLPNPATENIELRKLTKKLLIKEMLSADILNANYVVIHPGSYSEGGSFEKGVDNLVTTLDQCFDKLVEYNNKSKVNILLENVCVMGRKIGGSFEELNYIISKSSYKEKIGICLDTAHIYGYGYNLATYTGFKKFVNDLNNQIGFSKLKMFHLNDTKVKVGSQIDKHEHIGLGKIGKKGFERILNYDNFKSLCGIIETPKEAPFGEVSKKDIKNIKLLRNLIKN